MLGLSFASCDRPTSAKEEVPSDAPQGPGILEVGRSLGLFQTPAIDSELITTIKEGELLIPTGEYSGEWVGVSRNGRAICEPWLKVLTRKKESGWVMAVAEDFVIATKDIPEWEQNHRIRSLLRERTLQQLRGYQQTWESTTQASLLVVAMRNALAVKEELLTEMEGLPCQSQPDWLEALFPGFVLQKNSTQGIPYLWQDYGRWLERARETKGSADDRLMQLFCRMYPQDSIAYYYAAWQFPEPDGKYFSLLGRGIHRELMVNIEDLYKSEPFLEPELRQISQALLNDILEAPYGYWERKDAIVKELEEISGTPWSILQEADRVLLHRRLKAFKKEDADDIPTGLRLGQFLE